MNSKGTTRQAKVTLCSRVSIIVRKLEVQNNQVRIYKIINIAKSIQNIDSLSFLVSSLFLLVPLLGWMQLVKIAFFCFFFVQVRQFL